MKRIEETLSEEEWWNAESRLVWWQFLGLSEGAVQVLEDMAHQIQCSSNLMEFFRALHEQTAHRGEWHFDWSPLSFNPVIEAQLGNSTSLYYLLVYLSALPHILQAYQRRGISMDTFAETMADISFYIEWYAQKYGHWGFEHFPWIARHLSGRLVSLGRLQFALLPFPGKVLALRHRFHHQVILLADPDQPLRADGYAVGAGNPDLPVPTEEVWYPQRQESEDGWKGHPISPQGYALKVPAFFARDTWEIALKHGDWVLDVHIPQGKNLDLEDCRDSLQRAFAFFPRHFPESPFRGVYCHTWMFTPQLQHLLRPDSHILQFQREFYLYPHPGSAGFLLEFVFGSREYPGNDAPRDTSLRRAVLDWLSHGHELFDLPGVFLSSPQEWGKQTHRKGWLAFVTEE